MWGGGGGGETSFRVICRSGQPKNTLKKWEYCLEHFLPPQGWFLMFFPVFFALFRRRCLSCLTFSSVALAGQKACQFYIILLCFRPRRTWAHKGCQGCRGCRRCRGCRLFWKFLWWSAMLGMSQEKYSHFLGVVFGALSATARLVAGHRETTRGCVSTGAGFVGLL